MKAVAILEVMRRNHLLLAKVRVILSATSIFVLGITGWNRSALAEFYLHPWTNEQALPQTWSIQPQVLLYQSYLNFTDQSYKTPISQLENYTRLQSEVQVRYGLSPDFTLFGQLSWANISVERTLESATAYGLADQKLGVNWQAWSSKNRQYPLNLDLQLRVDFPLYSNDSARLNRTPYLGDGSVDVTFGGFFSAPLLKLSPSRSILGEIGGAYTYRTQGYSAALPWRLGLSTSASTTGWGGSLAMIGLTSLNSDSQIRAQVLDFLPSGGSSFIGAINPSLYSVQGTVEYRLNPQWAIQALYLASLSGSSAPSGSLFSLAIETRFGSSSHSQDFFPDKPSNEGFIDYTFEAKVVRVNDRLHLLKINQGSNAGVQLGQKYDVFATDPAGKPTQAVARAEVTGVRPDEAALTVREYFREVWIEEGFLVKRPLK